MTWAILTVTYNSQDDIKDLMQSTNGVKDQIGHWVWDNHSQDQTLSLLEQSHAQVISSQENCGFGKACNRLVASLPDEVSHLIFLNPDARFDQQCLEKLEAHFSNEQVALVGSQLLHGDGRRQNSIAAWPVWWHEFMPMSWLKLLWPARFAQLLSGDQSRQVPSVIGAFMAVRRSAFEAVSGFDERFFMFLEETDLCRRLHLQGLRVLSDPSIRIVHRQGQSVESDPARSRIDYLRSLLLFHRKWGGFMARPLAKSALMMRLSCNIIGRSLMLGLMLGKNQRLKKRWQRDVAALKWIVTESPAVSKAVL